MVELNIEDEIFENAVKDFIGKKGIEYCEKIITETLKDEVVTQLKMFSVNKVKELVKDYEISVMFKKEIREVVSQIVQDASRDINKDIRKMIDDSVKESLERGRVEAFVYQATKGAIHQYVESVFKNFSGEEADV